MLLPQCFAGRTWAIQGFLSKLNLCLKVKDTLLAQLLSRLCIDDFSITGQVIE